MGSSFFSPYRGGTSLGVGGDGVCVWWRVEGRMKRGVVSVTVEGMTGGTPGNLYLSYQGRVSET